MDYFFKKKDCECSNNYKIIENKIDELKLDLKEIVKDINRQKIEITVLTSPNKIIDFIEKNNYKRVKISNIEIIEIK